MTLRAILAARRGRGFRSRWLIPGYFNAVTYIPSTGTPRGWGNAVQWPHRCSDGSEVRHGADLSRHRALAKSEIRKLMKDQ